MLMDHKTGSHDLSIKNSFIANPTFNLTGFSLDQNSCLSIVYNINPNRLFQNQRPFFVVSSLAGFLLISLWQKFGESSHFGYIVLIQKIKEELSTIAGRINVERIRVP